MASKYERLVVYLSAARHNGVQQIAMTFRQLEAIIGERLPAVAQTRRSWWSTLRAATATTGWRVSPDLRTGTISFTRRDANHT